MDFHAVMFDRTKENPEGAVENRGGRTRFNSPPPDLANVIAVKTCSIIIVA